MNFPQHIDIIILSNGRTTELRSMTEQTIASLLSSEDPGQVAFHVCVIESDRSLYPFQYAGTTTLYPEVVFGFNKYLNIGITATRSPYVCLCNNDLIFHKNWASAILEAMKDDPHIYSANPFCDIFNYSFPVKRSGKVIYGHKKNFFKGALTGWCIFVKRDLFSIIGLFDERFSFWYADRDYGKTLLKHKVRHALILDAVVTHLGNRSHHTLPEDELRHLTYEQLAVYEAKWGKDRISLKEKLVRILKRPLRDIK